MESEQLWVCYYGWDCRDIQQNVCDLWSAIARNLLGLQIKDERQFCLELNREQYRREIPSLSSSVALL